MKTAKLKTFTQNPDNPQKYGDEEIAALVESIRKEPRTLGAAKIAFCTDYTATNGASYAGRRVVIAGNKRLQALHVHDVDWKHDNHDMPFVRKQNWADITKALGEIDYQGDFTFEADRWQARMPAELLEAASVMLAQVGRYLIGKVEENRPSGR